MTFHWLIFLRYKTRQLLWGIFFQPEKKCHFSERARRGWFQLIRTQFFLITCYFELKSPLSWISTFQTFTIGYLRLILFNNYAPRWRKISTPLTDTEVNNCFSIYYTSWITSGPKSNFICDNIPTKAILFFFGCSEVNSTWLITSEQANQRARKALFTCVVYTKGHYSQQLLYFIKIGTETGPMLVTICDRCLIRNFNLAFAGSQRSIFI